jgi:hypothetical protein
MDVKPKSIWKKSWKGRGAFFGWLVLATGLAFVVSLLGIIILDPWQWRADGGIVIVGTVGGAITALLFLFIRWLFYQRNLRRTLFGLACLVTLVALFYAEEDWHGWHAWNKFKHEWEAKGERFDFASVVPPPVPDDRNFALTPVVASSYLHILDKSGHRIKPPNTNIIDRLEMTVCNKDEQPTNGIGRWQKSTGSDLKVWQQYYRALAATTNLFPVAPQPQSPPADVLLALSKYDSAIEELRQAGQLPSSRFPLNYDDDDPNAILLPHLVALRRCSQMLQLRAAAELQNGQSDKALADVNLMLRLVDSIRTEPILISHLVRIAMTQIALQPVWEGLAEHKWSNEQLVSLDSELAKLNFLSDYGIAMRGEQACSAGTIDSLRHKRKSNICNVFTKDDWGFPRLFPGGWYYQNQLRYCRFFTRWYLPLADVEHGIFPPASLRNAVVALDAEFKRVSPYNQLEAMLLPALGGAVKKFASGQSSADLARTAIALERYRLARGEFPESLDVLAPQFIAKLPHDVINGRPLKYRRTSDGQFVLYSIGWNEADDGGTVVFRKGSTPGVDISQGDWVWRYPAQ